MEEQAVYKIQKHEGSRDGARKRVHAQRDTRSIKARIEKWTVRATKKFFVFVYVVPMAIRIALELARKGGVRGGSSM